jgi:hypothetical protein
VTRFASTSYFMVFIAILLTIVLAIPVGAQSTSICLEGTVWDPSNRTVPGATLAAVEQQTGRQYEAVSDANGEYRFLALQPGTYTVTVKAKDLKDVTLRNITLFTPGTITQDFAFEMSAVDKELAPHELMSLIDSEASRSFSHRDLEAVPLKNRDPLILLLYEPGVQVNSANPAYSTVNGTRLGMSFIGMDGLSITDPVNPRMGFSLLPMNPDSLADIQAVTTGATAEYGWSGGAQFMLVSRPGSKLWHGNAYDYFTSSKLGANDFFNNASNIPKPGLTQNLFGATASGPLGDKTLIFGNFQGNRTVQRITTNSQVLTPTAKTGVFQWYTPGTTNLQTYDIVANDPRHLGIDPTAAATLAKLPDPNNTLIGDGLNTEGYQFDNPTDLHQETVMVRADRTVNRSNHLFFRFNMDRSDGTDLLNNAPAPFPGQSSGTIFINNWGLAGGWDRNINPRMVNELRAGYTRPLTEFNNPDRSAPSTAFLWNSFTNPVNPSFPRSYKTPITEISDILSMSKTNHVFKYGLDFKRIVQNSVDYSGIYPNVTFGTSNGNAPSIGPSGASVISSADRRTFENLYNDLLGRMESVGQTYYVTSPMSISAGKPRVRSFSLQEYAAFVQDDWRIRPNLTLNLGLRYELSTAPKEQDGLQAVLDKAAQVSSTSQIVGFTIVPGGSWYAKSMKDFAPRAGFAWDISGSGNTILRGAYGIYYDRLIGGITNFIDQNTYGFSQTAYVYPNAGGGDKRLSGGIPALAQPAPPSLNLPATRSASIAILDPNLRTPRVDQFNLTLQKRLWGAVLEAGYVGTIGRRLFELVNLDQTKTQGDFLQAFQQLQAYRNSGTPVPPSNTLVRIFGTPLAVFNALGGSVFDSGQAGLAANTLDSSYYGLYAAAGVSDFYLRNFPQYNNLIYGSDSARSWYNSLQLGIRKSANSYHFRAYFTWSKSLDTMSMDGTRFVSPSDSFNPDSNKAPSDFDRTRVVNVAADYRIPFGRYLHSDSEMPKWIDKLFGGWNVGGLWLWESGARFSVGSGLQTLYGGVQALADYSGSRNLGALYRDPNGGIYWLNTDQTPLFTYPVAGETGTSGRNSFVGPSYFNIDCLLYKNFPVREKGDVQFRIEAFNVFNHTHFGLPETNLPDALFGRIVATQGTPRSIRLSLKYQF